MRTRAYRPEAPSSLEDRSLLSGVAGAAANPVVFPAGQFYNVITRMKVDFQMFTRNGNLELLQNQLLQAAVRVPYGGTNGLGISINAILKNMLQDINAKVPHAVDIARKDVIAVTRESLAASIQNGDVILR